jgi:hypothetical protein
MLPARLAFVQGDQHSDARVQRFRHQDVIEFGVIITGHVEVERYTHSRQYVFENIVNVVAAYKEEVEIFTGRRWIGLFLRILLQLKKIECLQALRRIAGAIARGYRLGLFD